MVHILSAFEEGADGVVVAGCLEGECHYKDGNIKAKERVVKIKRRLVEIGLEAERLEMYNLSATMAASFVEMASEMTERVKGLGPNPLKDRV